TGPAHPARNPARAGELCLLVLGAGRVRPRLLAAAVPLRPAHRVSGPLSPRLPRKVPVVRAAVLDAGRGEPRPGLLPEIPRARIASVAAGGPAGPDAAAGAQDAAAPTLPVQHPARHLRPDPQGHRAGRPDDRPAGRAAPLDAGERGHPGGAAAA